MVVNLAEQSLTYPVGSIAFSQGYLKLRLAWTKVLDHTVFGLLAWPTMVECLLLQLESGCAATRSTGMTGSFTHQNEHHNKNFRFVQSPTLQLTRRSCMDVPVCCISLHSLRSSLSRIRFLHCSIPHIRDIWIDSSNEWHQYRVVLTIITKTALHSQCHSAELLHP